MITVPPQNTLSTFPPKLLTHFNIRNYTDLQAVTDADWDTEVRKLMGGNQQHNLLNKRGVMLYAAYAALLEEGADDFNREWLLPASNAAFLTDSTTGTPYLDANHPEAVVDFLALGTLVEWFGNTEPAKIGRASCRKECRSRWSPYH